MANLTPVAVAETGLSLTTAAASAGGDKMTNDGKTYLYVKNTGLASRTITFDVPNSDDFGVSGAGLDRAVVVGAGLDFLIGPFSIRKFNVLSAGADLNKIIWTYSSEADLVVKALLIG